MVLEYICEVQIFEKYKSIWLFLAKFFGTYIVLSIGYQKYISGCGASLDGVTLFFLNIVSKLFSWVLPNITTYVDCCQPMGEVRYENVPIILMIEGCNALSILILFVSFLVAFKASIKSYVWFVPMGIIFIAVANVIRIVLIGLIYLYYPSFTDAAHDYLFPGIIYGSVFLLWMIWVKYIATSNEK